MVCEILRGVARRTTGPTRQEANILPTGYPTDASGDLRGALALATTTRSGLRSVTISGARADELHLDQYANETEARPENAH